MSDAVLRVENIWKSFGELEVLKGISFDVAESEVKVIFGPSGSGKSTLLRHMIGLKSPAKGDIYIRGENLWKSSEARRTEIVRSVGVLFQSGALWSSMTLAENVAAPVHRFVIRCFGLTTGDPFLRRTFG